MSGRGILVIKHGALGDFVQAFGPFAAIRARHAAEEVTLLTTRPFVALAEASPWFDRIMIDDRPRWWGLPKLARLRRRLRGFDFVYDMQTSRRSSHYFRLAGRPGWSGIAAGASHPHANPNRNAMHTLDRQREQLALAGVTVRTPDLTWLRQALPGALADSLPAPFAVLVPGASPHRPAKRWPAERFGEVARALAARQIRPVVVGAAADRALAAVIRRDCPMLLDLTGQTSLTDLAALCAHAEYAIGNDTGPMHLAAQMECRCVVLFSGASDPALTAPRAIGRGAVRILRRTTLGALPAGNVLAALETLSQAGERP